MDARERCEASREVQEVRPGVQSEGSIEITLVQSRDVHRKSEGQRAEVLLSHPN